MKVLVTGSVGFKWAKAHGTFWHVERNFIDNFHHN